MSLGQKARTAVIWNTGFNLFRDLLQFVVMLVLVRLLEPGAYGQFSLVTSIIGFISIFSFSSFVAHTLQIRDDQAVHYQEHFTAGAVIVCTLFLFTNVIAIVLRWIPAYSPVVPLIHVMSFTFLLEWPCELRRKMLEREFDWKRLRLLHASGLIFSSILSLVMAWAGAGVYALVIPGMTVTIPFILDLFLGINWRPKWTWSWANYREAWKFGLNRIGSGAALTIRQLSESAILVKVLGYTSLGILNRSLGLAQMFCSKFASQLMYAIYPVLTRLNQNQENITRVNALIIRIVAWMAIPIAVIFSVLASPVVHTVYGLKWAEVIPLLPWTMLGGVMIALAQTTNGLLLAQHHTKHCLIADILVLSGTILMLLLVMPHGVRSYLIGLATIQLAALSLMSFWLCRSKALSPSGIIWAVGPALVASGLAYLLCTLTFGIFGSTPTSFVTASIYGTYFILIYLVMLRLIFPMLLKEIVGYMPAQATLRRFLMLRSAI